MSDDGWIDFEDKMPNLNEEIEIRYYNDIKHDYEICKSNLRYRISSNSFYFDNCGVKKIEDWRPFRKKRPDFGKLKEGYLIVYEWENKPKNSIGKTAGFFDKIYGGAIQTYSDILSDEGSLDIVNMDLITKITRINLEEKKFEEI